LLLRVFQSLVGKSEGLLVDARLLVGTDQVPVDILDLGNGGDDLILESDVGDFLVVAGDAQIAEIRA
jgi:hypothetical protein